MFRKDIMSGNPRRPLLTRIWPLRESYMLLEDIFVPLLLLAVVTIFVWLFTPLSLLGSAVATFAAAFVIANFPLLVELLSFPNE